MQYPFATTKGPTLSAHLKARRMYIVVPNRNHSHAKCAAKAMAIWRCCDFVILVHMYFSAEDH